MRLCKAWLQNQQDRRSKSWHPLIGPVITGTPAAGMAACCLRYRCWGSAQTECVALLTAQGCKLVAHLGGGHLSRNSGATCGAKQVRSGCSSKGKAGHPGTAGAAAPGWRLQPPLPAVCKGAARRACLHERRPDGDRVCKAVVRQQRLHTLGGRAWGNARSGSERAGGCANSSLEPVHAMRSASYCRAGSRSRARAFHAVGGPVPHGSTLHLGGVQDRRHHRGW